MIISEVARGIRKQRKRFFNWIDAFWGYDVFIAHRRADAADYARKLYEALKTDRISCFIDRAVYGPGDFLRSPRSAMSANRHCLCCSAHRRC